MAFGLVTTSMVDDFTYAAVLSTLTGGGSIYYMVVTIVARGIFGNENLEYMREFKSGTSAFGYWFSKVLFNVMAMFLFALCYSLPYYWLMPVPAQPFFDFFSLYLMASWYHCGLGMMISV